MTGKKVLLLIFLLALANVSVANVSAYSGSESGYYVKLVTPQGFSDISSEDAYKMSFSVNPATTGFLRTEGSYKLGLNLYTSGVGGGYSEGGFKLYLVPEQAFISYTYGITANDPIELPYTHTDVGVTVDIELSEPSEIVPLLPPGTDISNAIVINVNVIDDTPGNPNDDAYTDITINVGELDVETCEVYKEGSGFLPEVDAVTTLPTVKPPGVAKFSRDVANNSVIIRLYVGDPLLGVIPQLIEGVFDTGKGTYPSIMGTHEGKITPNKKIVVHKMYTYPCVGTGGHTEYVRFYGNGLDVNKTWNGYGGDYHNIIFDPPITLQANTPYNYEIRTGSYPQIIREQSLPTANGTINCTRFTDANGKTYNDWIPAIRLE